LSKKDIENMELHLQYIRIRTMVKDAESMSPKEIEV